MIFFNIKYLSLIFWLKEFKWRKIYKKLSKIELLVLDIDGVLTDGGLWYGENGDVFKRFSVKDGLGLKMLQKNNITIAFLSGSDHLSNKLRAQQLNIDLCFSGIKNKFDKVKTLSNQLNIPLRNIAFVGDDVNDIPVQQIIGLFLAPIDASNSVIKKADAIMHLKGGKGAIRELAERILEAKNKLNIIREEGWKDKND